MQTDDFYYIYRLINYCQVDRFVRFEDLGLKYYGETWEYQEEVFNRLMGLKLANRNLNEGEKEKVVNTLIFVEHPHVYTLGKSGSGNNLLLDNIQLQAKNASFYNIDRGGDITYHGPGQIVGYPIIDLEIFDLKLKQYIHKLEESIIGTLSEFGIFGERLEGATGVWLDKDIKGKARKICAIGVKASRYVTMHGFAFNVNTNLDYFNYINPCGFTDKGVTSLEKELGRSQDIGYVKSILRTKLEELFGFEWIK
ncbi:MAG: lipoyl(octanoyl) transferase LipB [Bacteroidia bacterium]|nr:MAG: lipoyl(octanoyl) transferase LipB [Bacteroidia bacterium]